MSRGGRDLGRPLMAMHATASRQRLANAVSLTRRRSGILSASHRCAVGQTVAASMAMQIGLVAVQTNSPRSTGNACQNVCTEVLRYHSSTNAMYTNTKPTFDDRPKISNPDHE